jgi:hypothetical protein
MRPEGGVIAGHYSGIPKVSKISRRWRGSFDLRFYLALPTCTEVKNEPCVIELYNCVSGILFE